MSMMIDRQIRQAPIINPCQCNIKTEKYNFTTLIQVLCLNLPCFLFSHMRCTLSCSRGDGPLSKHVQPSFMLSFPCVIWYCKLLLMIRKKKKKEEAYVVQRVVVLDTMRWIRRLSENTVNCRGTSCWFKIWPM